MARNLDYVPIPKSVYKVMEQGWTNDIVCNGQSVWK
jgi:hypothetical protein